MNQQFTRIALQKLNELLCRRGFIKIIGVEYDCVTIVFEDRTCSISAFGNVKWFERQQK